MMEREETEGTAAIELGTASLVTEGGMGDVIEAMGLWHKAGISDA
jgi:hypothetical protein